ncbi:MAG: substrate-binding domain-containing protein [Sphingomonadales bacterium]|nr:substrate-binding domain-containing protein [Sphingomonadales bacterium]
MRWRVVLLPLIAVALCAQVEPPHRSGPVTIATNAQLAPLLRSLAAAFEHSDGGSPLVIAVVGSDVAMARLTTGTADAAIIERPAYDPEAKAYEWVYRRPPTPRVLFSGSAFTAGKAPDLAFRVNSDNPLKVITLDQIRRAFAQTDSALTWRALGVQGALADQRVRLDVPDTESGTGRFLRAAALDGQVQLPWNRVAEFAPVRFDDDGYTARIAAAVARDCAALGVGDAAPMAGTRVLAIVVEGKALLPGDTGYPLARSIVAYGDSAPRPAVSAFFRFLETPAARTMIADAGYRP